MQNFPLFGHRGSGAEGVAYTDGYYRVNVQENTILSFVTAASLGAQYVEFGMCGVLKQARAIVHVFVASSVMNSFPPAQCCGMVESFCVPCGLCASRAVRYVCDSALCSH